MEMRRIQKNERNLMIVTKDFLLRRYRLSENVMATSAAVLGIAGGSMAMPPEEDMPAINRVLQGLGHAEHRGRVKGSIFDYDPKYYIRTGKPDPILNANIPADKVKHSTAYGPFQFTKSTVEDLSKRHPKLFAGTEGYVGKFISQGKEMLKDPEDTTYGYGKPGVLSGEEHHSGYMDMSKAALAAMASDLKINLQTMTPEQEQRLIQRFRGVKPEKSYMAAYRAGQAVQATETQNKSATTKPSGTTGQQSGSTVTTGGQQKNPVTTQQKPVTTGSYEVQAGDNLYRIAQKHGKKLDDIIKANPQIKDPSKIQPKDKIIIP
jgi:LysM repeat protein